ncbi:MAG: glycosyltransferase family 2 protein [Bacteroidia bacterium]|nr:glycosyltransferase family 2 protein [Bacteroidia bacterium]
MQEYPTGQPPALSVVSPVYGCAKLVPELVRQLVAVVEPLVGPNFEIILVNDGSPDGAWPVIRELYEAEPRVVGINLSRNFGQHAAITAGLAHARGQWVVVMDCDLQDRPDQIPLLYQHAIGSDSDLVQAQRTLRKDSLVKRITSYLFYKVLSYLTDARYDPRIANFGLYRRKVIDAILQMPEQNRVFPVMLRWVGFRATAIPVQHAARPEGKSSYSYSQLLRLAVDVLLAHSDKPLRLVVKAGITLSVITLLVALYVLIRALLGTYTVSGYASIMISIWFLSGLIISILGILGLYVGKIFESVKQRPIYIVNDLLRSK